MITLKNTNPHLNMLVKTKPHLSRRLFLKLVLQSSKIIRNIKHLLLQHSINRTKLLSQHLLRTMFTIRQSKLLK